MATQKLTKRAIDALVPLNARYIVWDAEIAGLGIQVAPTGKRKFVLFYRTRDGVQRKPTLGAYGTLTLEQARDLARDMLANVRRGEDPSSERQRARAASTVNDAADRYMAEHARLHKKKRSADGDEINLRLHIRPRWGTRKIASITYNDVVALHMAMKETPGAANRTVALLSKLFNLAEAWGLRPQNSNPCKHVRKYAEKKIHNHLSEIELARLAKVLRAAEAAHARVRLGRPEEKDFEIAAHPIAIAAIRLLILMGMRKGEVLRLKWSEVDYDAQVLRLEDAKDQRADKPREPKVLPLNGPAADLIKSQKRTAGSPWVFPGRDPAKPFVGLPKIATRLYKSAGLGHLRPAHDFRHNFGSTGTGENLSLTLIGALMGHKSTLTTQRYAQAADDPRRRASELVGQKLSDAMSVERERHAKK